MSTPVVYITLLLHCIGKNVNLLIVFGKMPLKGRIGAFEIFCCLAYNGISLTTFLFSHASWQVWRQTLSSSRRGGHSALFCARAAISEGESGCVGGGYRDCRVWVNSSSAGLPVRAG